MQRILVTGAVGFVGSILIPKLIQAGYSVTGLDRLPGSDIVLDCADLTVEQLVNYDSVIHLANTARIEPSWISPSTYFDNNVSKTVDLFLKCQLAGIKRFFYFSSSSVYGNNGTQLQKEGSILVPTSPYAVSKMTAEQTLTLYSQRDTTTSLVIIRPFTMYGSTMAVDTNALAIGKFVRSYVRDDPLVIQGSGNQKRDFLHVDEAAEAMLLLLKYVKFSDVYNLGSGHSVSINNIAEVISNKKRFVPPRPGPDYDTCADITKIQKLGFSPKIQVLEWLRKQKQDNFKEFTCL